MSDATTLPFLPEGLFRGKVVFVTGGGTGLGLAVGTRLGRLGADVACASREVANHAEILARGRAEGFRVMSLAMDVRRPDEVREAFRRVAAEWGGVDVLVNNAAGNFIRPSLLLAPKAFATVIDIALTGVFTCSREAARQMKDRGGGVIVNVSAPYAFGGKPGVAHSAAAKAGVESLTRTLAAEWAPLGIRVNAVSPGPFESRGAADRLWPSEDIETRVRAQIPLGRFGTAEEVAEVVGWLAAPTTAWMTGSVVVLDGGWTLPGALAGGDVEVVRRRRRSADPDGTAAAP